MTYPSGQVPYSYPALVKGVLHYLAMESLFMEDRVPSVSSWIVHPEASSGILDIPWQGYVGRVFSCLPAARA